MRGTASHSLAYEDVRVPARNIVGTGEGILQPDFVPRFGLGYSAVYLGAGAAALDWIVDYALKRKLLPDNVPIASYPRFCRQIGRENCFETAVYDSESRLAADPGRSQSHSIHQRGENTASKRRFPCGKGLKNAGGDPACMNDKRSSVSTATGRARWSCRSTESVCKWRRTSF